MRHWSLIRMLYCPDLSPLSFSSRLEGGIRKELSSLAAASISSFRAARRWILREILRVKRPLWIFSVSLDLNDLITTQNTIAQR